MNNNIVEKTAESLAAKTRGMSIKVHNFQPAAVSYSGDNQNNYRITTE